MTGDDPAPRPAPVPDLGTYERRLRGGMRLMAAKDRDAVAREIIGGVESQVAAGGGDFAAVAADLDDPSWVGRQMVKVYGVAAPWTLAFAVVSALLAWASAPGALLAPATDAASIGASLAAFGVLLALLFWLTLRQMPRTALVAAGAALALRLVALAVPQEGVALFDLLSGGELALYLLATLLLLLVAGVPALALRGRGDDD